MTFSPHVFAFVNIYTLKTDHLGIRIGQKFLGDFTHNHPTWFYFCPFHKGLSLTCRAGQHPTPKHTLIYKHTAGWKLGLKPLVEAFEK